MTLEDAAIAFLRTPGISHLMAVTSLRLPVIQWRHWHSFACQ